MRGRVGGGEGREVMGCNGSLGGLAFPLGKVRALQGCELRNDVPRLRCSQVPSGCCGEDTVRLWVRNRAQDGGDCTVQTRVGAEEVGSARFWITMKVGLARLVGGSDVGERQSR